MPPQHAQAAAALPQPRLIKRESTGLGAALRALLDDILAPWSDYVERRRRIRELESLAGMDAHTLRDIGASEALVARAIDRANQYRRRAHALYPSRASIDVHVGRVTIDVDGFRL